MLFIQVIQRQSYKRKHVSFIWNYIPRYIPKYIPRYHRQFATVVPIQDKETTKQSDWMKEAVLYVHWPFCKRRCTYCNFNKYIERKTDNLRITKCLITELQTLIKISGIHQINSIFFGGGTPSLAEPETFERIINEVKKFVYLPLRAEISMEANPTELEAQKLVDFKSAGINRLSIGLQALNKNDLLILGRDHSVEESIDVLHHARKLFPGSTSVDIIFGRPGQTVASWVKELEQLLKYTDDHISLYQLTLERGTKLFEWHKQRKITVPESDVSAEMYEVALSVLAEAGYKRYEVSNFARIGAECEHNKAYWSGSQYLGVGPGAHGRFVPLNQHAFKDPSIQNNKHHKIVHHECMVTTCNKADSEIDFESHCDTPLREARIQTLEPLPWMREVEQYGHGTRKRLKQPMQEILQEIIMLGMRTNTGILNTKWVQFTNGISLDETFQRNESVQLLENQGFITFSNDCLKPTDHGLTLADSVTTELILALENNFIINNQ